jgi:hypothetical protein
MREAIRSRGIRITEVLSGPTYRAIETARRMGYSDIRPVDEGEALIFRPAADGDPAMVARLAITEWPNL